MGHYTRFFDVDRENCVVCIGQLHFSTGRRRQSTLMAAFFSVDAQLHFSSRPTKVSKGFSNVTKCSKIKLYRMTLQDLITNFYNKNIIKLFSLGSGVLNKNELGLFF